MLLRIISLLLFISFEVMSQSVVVPIYHITEHGLKKSLGSVRFIDTELGLLILPQLKGLSTGMHGFHVHEKPSCDKGGMAAGGHLDPAKTEKHSGPFMDDGHIGDLPAIYFDNEKNANLHILAPRLLVSDILNRSLIIHEGGDNYTEEPPMGGGGKRIACGVIPDEAEILNETE